VSPPSAYTLTARNAGGRSLAAVPMTFIPGHSDHAGPLDELIATVPAAHVDSVQIASNGAVLASRGRLARAPRVRILAPRRGARLGRAGTILLRWSATDPEHVALTASVDYSRDGGRSWRTIFIGPNRGRALLPSFYFSASRRARVRVRVNDGFNEAVATSAPFTALGAPPQVSILSPTPATRLAGDARLSLSGEAFDQQLRRLSGAQLRWFDGPFALGRGATLTAPPLPPGANRIRLVARDRAGHTATKTVVVSVGSAVPGFLQLNIPAHVSRRATALTIGASSAIPASLSVGRATLQLGRARSELHVRIPRGRKPLLLQMRVTADGHARPFAAEVSRTA
jgi:hypothetical protein